MARLPLAKLTARFGSRLQENVVMANYTTAHVGGLADALLVAQTLEEFEQTMLVLWELKVPYILLGAGSNVLISDEGIRGVVVINHCHNIKIDVHTDPPSVWAESGANLGSIARQVALRGLSGIEWASTIPGSLGGAVYGNAGAHGGNMQGSLIMAEILQQSTGRQTWTAERMGYAYRSSTLKRSTERAVILAARLRLSPSTPEEVKERIAQNSARRRATQPPGASLGSMFKNPPGDYAGRLIEAAGLKGTVIGDAEISPIHANFFINRGNATASDLRNLVQLARKTVEEKFGVALELEVEFIGDWSKAK